MRWLPEYLSQTAYGERYKMFFDDLDNNRYHDGEGSGNDSSQSESDNDGADSVDDDGQVDDTTRWNLPQIFPTRSAAELDARGEWVMRPYPVDDGKADFKIKKSVATKAALYAKRSRREMGVPPLPESWALKLVPDSPQFRLGVNAGSTVTFSVDKTSSSDSMSLSQDVFAVRSDHAIPTLCGVYYYEVKVTRMVSEELMSIGLSEGEAHMVKLPGLDGQSWGYHSDDGRIIACQGTAKNFGPKYGVGDIIGCGVNFRKRCVFYTKNGVYLGVAFKDVTGHALYPCIGLKQGQSCETNFGKEEFIYDIDKYIREEKEKVAKEIDPGRYLPKAVTNTTDRGTKFESGGNGGDTDEFVQQIVASYLSHVGMLETAKAFESERRITAGIASTTNDAETSVESMNIDESSAEMEVYNRQQIREMVLKGDIDGTMKRLQLNYPEFCKSDNLILFKLQCRKFIELVRHSVLPTASDLPAASQSDKIKQVLAYGQELQKQYRDDARDYVKSNLEKSFALLAYEDPTQHPEVAELFDDNALIQLSEELNSEILVSLGKPSTPSLQKLAQHVTQLVWELQDQGIDQANLLNVGVDYLD